MLNCYKGYVVNNNNIKKSFDPGGLFAYPVRPEEAKAGGESSPGRATGTDSADKIRIDRISNQY